MSPEIQIIKRRLNLGSKLLFLAQSETGKSALARELTSVYPRKIYIDIMREPEYDDLPSVDNLANFYKALKYFRDKKEFKLVYRMKAGTDKKVMMELMNEICRLVWAFKNVHLFVDECDNYSTPHLLPPAYSDILRRGRHQSVLVSMTNVTQTPTDLNKMIVKQSNEKFYGFFSERNDLNYIYSLGTWTMEDLLAVKKYEFIHEHNREWQKIKLQL